MISIDKRALMIGAAVLGFGALTAAPAAAQATRTWVSGVGDDANPCSRTAPCKTFPGAISKTAAGGEINCIDPGGFGAVTITKSMTIQCDDVEAGILVVGSPGITVNAASTDTVTISGIDIFGVSPSNPGTNGINFVNGGVLNVRHTTIKGFGTQAILFQPQTASAALNVDDVIINSSGTVGDTTTGAIKVLPANNMTATVTINNTRVSGNANVGLRLDLTGTTGTKINATVVNSVLSGNTIGTQIKAPGGTGTVDATFSGVTISGNTSLGVLGNGSSATARFSASTITGNGAGSAAAITGVNASASSVLSSYGNNVLDGNFNSSGTAANGAFSGTIPLH